VTAADLCSELARYAQCVRLDGANFTVEWDAPPPSSVLESLRRLTPEVWCLLTVSWRLDCRECPLCGHPLVTRIVHGWPYRECLDASHFSMEDVRVRP
jgi:hypothetical protein